MTKPPVTSSTSGDQDGEFIRPSDKFDLSAVDQLSPEDLADYLYDLAEKVIEDPLAYKVEFGLSSLDIAELDNIDLSSAEGRKKLAKLFRLLAKQVFKGKNIYIETVLNQSQNKGQMR